jgi:chromosome segregation ATPase
LRIKFANELERENLVIVFLLVWLVLLTAGIAVGGLMVIGKFVRIGREVNEALEKVYDDIEEIHGVVDAFLEGFRNVQPDIQNLLIKVKTLEENPSEVSRQIEQIENRIGQIYETGEGLRQDINLLLGADKEHPVLAPSKGGRPRKEPV